MTEQIKPQNFGVRFVLHPGCDLSSKKKEITLDHNPSSGNTTISYFDGITEHVTKYKDLNCFIREIYRRKDISTISRKILELIFYVYNYSNGFKAAVFKDLDEILGHLKEEFLIIGLCDKTYNLSSFIIYKEEKHWYDGT